MSYDFVSIEKHWRQHWEQERTFRTPNPGDADFDPSRPKYYVLDMFPYPSGVGLHVGHPLGYIATDVVARFKRMRGFNVLHPMGFDAFGLPAEQYAIEHGIHPRITTEKNIANMVEQLQLLGLSYDWERRFATTDPDYYRWTQWIFLQLYHSWFDPKLDRARPIADLEKSLASGGVQLGTGHLLVAPGTDGARAWTNLDPRERALAIDAHRLAYMAELEVNWCPGLGTVLANEEVTADGRSERGNLPVFKRPLRQWMLRITAYAERLDRDLALVNWPESVNIMQRNWIGRSEGAFIDFQVAASTERIRVFTTRPDTLFGATYMVLAPEHPLVSAITTSVQRFEVEAYRRTAAAKDDATRQEETASGKKGGVFTGAHAIHPATLESIPIWIADYVLKGYGTGAIMAVPGHDARDFGFARHFGLPIRAVVADADWIAEHGRAHGWTEANESARLARYRRDLAALPEPFCGEGQAIDSSGPGISLDGLATADAKRKMRAWLSDTGHGRAAVQYKLRDWLFSRQRYWGEPFPILHAPDGTIVAVPEAELPVELPPMDDFRPESSDDPNAPPRPPLTRAPESWRVVVKDGVRYTRELNTMPNWAGSCWYYLRFVSPTTSDRLVDAEAEKVWMAGSGVDLYVGGVEHAVLHLLYARFWHKVLFDLGHVSTPEPFGRLYNQGYILAPSYQNARGMYVNADEVVERDGGWYHHDEPVERQVGKMGKSLKNAIGPDEFCAQYGADTLRLYEMYLGPLDRSKIWSTSDIMGVHRFLQRLWRNFHPDRDDAFKVSEAAPTLELKRLLHRTIKRVTDDYDSLNFNTAIARMIELNNALVGLDRLPRAVAEPLVLLLAPLAPHIAEELWLHLGHQESLAYAPWPQFDPAMLIEATIEFPVQVNGKLRSRIFISPQADDATIEKLAREEEKVVAAIADKTVKKVIVVKGRLINIVVG